MMDEQKRIAGISDSQRQCLLMVGQGMSSKEIAAKTGLTWQTVDTYLKQAMHRLGASNRREAARMLASFEVSRQSGSPSPDVAPEPKSTDQGRLTDGSLARRKPVLPPVGGSVNDLTWDQKSLKALHVAALAAGVVVAIALGFVGLLQTF